MRRGNNSNAECTTHMLYLSATCKSECQCSGCMVGCNHTIWRQHQPAAPSRSSSKHYQQAATASSKQHMLQCCYVWWQYGSTCKVCSCPADLSYTAVLVLVGRYWPSGQASTNSPVGASAIHQHLESCRHGSKPPFGCTQPSSCKTGCPALSRVLYHNPTATSQ